MKKSIGIIFGGISSEHAVSCVSAANVFDNISKDKFDVTLFGITKDGVWYNYTGNSGKMRDGSWENDKTNLFSAFISPDRSHHGAIIFDGEAHRIKRLDAVFPVLHGACGEDGTMQGLLKIAGIPYVGCDTCSSALSMDKNLTKLIARSAGVPVANSVTLVNNADFDMNRAVYEAEAMTGYPMFVKPCNAGSSVGVSKAHNRAELIRGIENAFTYDKKVLVEEFMQGSEIEVAVIGNDSPVSSRTGEIVPNASFYDYDTKYNSDSAEYYIPARLPDETAEKIRAAAIKVYTALGCEGLSRVDFFADGNKFCFNEINTIPGFTSISMYPTLMRDGGLSYPDLIERLIELAISRGV